MANPSASGPRGKEELRLWLSLMACSNLVSAEIRRRLRAEFQVTLPQFDLMAQLQREPEGLRLGELSRRLMVTNGNVTGLVDKLLGQGFLTREQAAEDRRAQIVRLTKAGAILFERMAAAHERWLVDILSSLDAEGRAELAGRLGRLKRTLRDRAEKTSGPASEEA